MNTTNKEQQFNWYLIMFLIAFTPCLMMTGIFIGLVFEFGIFPAGNISENSQIFAEKYAWIIWFVGFWSTVQLLAIVPIFLISMFNKQKHA